MRQLDRVVARQRGSSGSGERIEVKREVLSVWKLETS